MLVDDAVSLMEFILLTQLERPLHCHSSVHTAQDGVTIALTGSVPSVPQTMCHLFLNSNRTIYLIARCQPWWTIHGAILSIDTEQHSVSSWKDILISDLTPV